MTPAQIVQQQLDAYNHHDLDAFVATYSETVRIFRLPAVEPAITGRAQLAGFYATQRFNLPGLHAELLNRMALGNKVVDHERIRGLRDEPVDAVAVYAIAGGVIECAWFFSPD